MSESRLTADSLNAVAHKIGFVGVRNGTACFCQTLAISEASSSSGSIIFDGLADDGQALRIGIYNLFLEEINENPGVVENLKSIVVVARRLY